MKNEKQVKEFLKEIKESKATHVFYFSKRQMKIVRSESDSFSKMIGAPELVGNQPSFNGAPYSEMREFKCGFSNFDDAVIVGIGSISDVNN